MLASYRAKPKAMAPHLKRWIDHMIDDEQLPTLIHCTGGKDRTGVVIAFLLAAIEVPRLAIDEDYLASDFHTGRRFLPAVLEAMRAVYNGPIDPAMIDPMLGVRLEYLDAAFEAAGPFDAYLDDWIGLTPERRNRLRALLLEDAE